MSDVDGSGEEEMMEVTDFIDDSSEPVAEDDAYNEETKDPPRPARKRSAGPTRRATRRQAEPEEEADPAVNGSGEEEETECANDDETAELEDEGDEAETPRRSTRRKTSPKKTPKRKATNSPKVPPKKTRTSIRGRKSEPEAEPAMEEKNTKKPAVEKTDVPVKRKKSEPDLEIPIDEKTLKKPAANENSNKDYVEEKPAKKLKKVLNDVDEQAKENVQEEKVAKSGKVVNDTDKAAAEVEKKEENVQNEVESPRKIKKKPVKPTPKGIKKSTKESPEIDVPRQVDNDAEDNVKVIEEETVEIISSDDEVTSSPSNEKKKTFKKAPIGQKAKKVAKGKSTKTQPSVENESENDTSSTKEKNVVKENEDKQTEKSESSSKPAEDENIETIENGKKESGRRTSKVFSKREMLELEKYWKAVKENPQDFTAWTYLLQFVEQDTEMVIAREAFDTFFERYPYCYGYWKKYADLEKKNGFVDKCQEVFERGTVAVPLSVDFWIHYLNYYKTLYKDNEDGEELIRKEFEKAVKAAGIEFRCDRLWDMYINWETEFKNYKNVTALYDRLLNIPTQLYSHHFDMFQKHVNKHHPKDIVSTDEFLALHRELVSTQDPDIEEIGGDSPPPGMEDEAAPGEETKQDSKKINSDALKVRNLIIEKRQAVHKANEEEVSKRWTFEEGIKRPYFHVKPLEKAQLKNWKEYLDFEIEDGTPERVIVLFERCMIPCALYEEFWLKYAKYLDGYTSEGARSVYRRACMIHLPNKALLHLNWASYEEKLNKYETAAEILQKIEEKTPGYLPIMFRRINLERRLGKKEAVPELFEQYIKKHEGTDVGVHIVSKYARYCNKVLGNLTKAVEIIEKTIEKCPENSRLYMQLVDLYYQQTPLDVQAIAHVFDRAVIAVAEPKIKLQFSARKIELLEDFGMDVQQLQNAHEENSKLCKQYQAEKKKKSVSEEVQTAEQAAKTSKGSETTSNVTTVSSVSTSQQPSYIQPIVGAAQTPYSSHTMPDHSQQHANSYYQAQPAWPNYQTTGYAYSQTQQQWANYGGHYYPQ